MREKRDKNKKNNNTIYQPFLHHLASVHAGRGEDDCVGRRGDRQHEGKAAGHRRRYHQVQRVRSRRLG